MVDESSLPVSDDSTGVVSGPRFAWEVPEVAAVVILVAVGLLVLGGLATGVAAAVGAPGSFGAGAGLTIAGSSIETRAEWADPLLAIVLLGVLGLCWWQVDGWSEATDDIDLSEVAGHIQRGRQIAWWVQGALGGVWAGAQIKLAADGATLQ